MVVFRPLQEQKTVPDGPEVDFYVLREILDHNTSRIIRFYRPFSGFSRSTKIISAFRTTQKRPRLAPRPFLRG
jgi:hypothetical protein